MGAAGNWGMGMDTGGARDVDWVGRDAAGRGRTGPMGPMIIGGGGMVMAMGL